MYTDMTVYLSIDVIDVIDVINILYCTMHIFTFQTVSLVQWHKSFLWNLNAMEKRVQKGLNIIKH